MKSNNFKEEIQKLCKLYDIYPSKSKGQNFLVDEDAYGKIIQYAEVSANDTILEVGPGFGTLTAFLAQKANKVIAVEVDKKLVEMLRAQLMHFKNIKIVYGDILHMSLRGTDPPAGGEVTKQSHGFGGLPQSLRSFAMTMEGSYKIVANLPYNITSHFLRKFLTLPFSPLPSPPPASPAGRPQGGMGDVVRKISSPLVGEDVPPKAFGGTGEGEITLFKPSLMVLMLQKEVAERICAKTGEMSMLSFSVQFYAQPEIMENVPKENFWPLPKVDSSIIKIVPYSKEKIEALLKNVHVDEKTLFRVAKWGFSSRRKQLHNNIASGLFTMLKRKATLDELESVFQDSKIHPQLRAQDVSIQDWLNLARAIHEKFKV